MRPETRGLDSPCARTALCSIRPVQPPARRRRRAQPSRKNTRGRRLRGRVVKILRNRELDSPPARIRMAQLSIDSDQTVDTALLVTAAKDAIFLSNLPLGERIARAAFQRGGGLRGRRVALRALLWQGRPAQAEQILAGFDPDGLDELQLVL